MENNSSTCPGLVPFNCTSIFFTYFYHEGKYLNEVERVMAYVERITEYNAQVPVAAFIFGYPANYGLNFSTYKYVLKILLCQNKIQQLVFHDHVLFFLI